MWDKIKAFVTEHPYITGLAVFGVGIVIILYYSGRSSSGGGSADMSAYYGAAAAATVSGNQVAMAQIAAQAQTNQANIASQVAFKNSDNQLAAILAAITGQSDVETIRASAAKDIASLNSTTLQNISLASIRENEFNNLVQANTMQQIIGMLKGYGITVGNLSPTFSFT